MDTFRLWLEQEESEASRLEAAVKEFVSSKRHEPAYYAPYADLDSEERLKSVLAQQGLPYDPKFKLVRGAHPAQDSCEASSKSLAKFLRERGFDARVTFGGYLKAGHGFPGSGGAHGRGHAHFWVEVGNFLVDVTQDQFHPLSPERQKGYSIIEKGSAYGDSPEYQPTLYLPHGRAVKLPENLQRMADKIVSMKSFQGKNSLNHARLLEDWLRKNAAKHGMDEFHLETVLKVLNYHANREPFYLSDPNAIESLLAEPLTSLPEDEAVRSTWTSRVFAPPERRRSLGTLRLEFGRVEISSVTEVTDEAVQTAQRIVLQHYPGATLGPVERQSPTSAYKPVHRASFKVPREVGSYRGGPEMEKKASQMYDDLRKSGFSIK